jgi:hypothetical protein
MADILTTATKATWMTKARVILLGSDDSTTLPEATLNVFVDDVERDLKAKVTDWATLTEDNLAHLVSAAVCALCAKLAPSMPILVPKIEKAIDFSETRDMNWQDVEARLLGEADVYLNNISTYTPAVVVRAAVITPSTAMWETLE